MPNQPEVNFSALENLVTWWGKKQSVLARRNAETEFRAMTHGKANVIITTRT